MTYTIDEQRRMSFDAVFPWWRCTLPLLRLPYFWDEAGYYIPAARDLLLTDR